MNLIIKRDQKAQKGVFGGHKGMSFLLTCRVELSEEEQDLLAKYKAEEYPLTYRTTEEGSQIPWHTISDVVKGVNYEVKDVATLLSNEETMKEACKAFKTLLTVMASFGGEEVLEF